MAKVLYLASSSGSYPICEIKNTNAGATSGELKFIKDSASPAADDQLGSISFYGDDAGGTSQSFGQIKCLSTAVTAGSESGSLHFYTATTSSGALTEVMKIEGGAAATSSTVTALGTLNIGDDLSLTSDSAVFNMGADTGFSITHDGDVGATIAGSPITITAAEASTWSTSAGALTITAAAASTWSTSAGALTLTSAAEATWSTSAGALTINGTTGINIQEGGATIIGIDDTRNITTTNTAAINLDCSGAMQLNSTGGAISIGNDAVAQAINIGTGGAARTITVGNATGTTALDINLGTGGLNVDCTDGGLISLDAIGAPSNFTLTSTAAADDLTIALAGATNSSLILSSTGTGADALQITASAGGLDITSSLALDITTSGNNSNITIDPHGSGTLALGSADNTAVTIDALALTLTSVNALTLTDGTASFALGGSGATSLSSATTLDLDCSGTMQLNSTSGAISIGNDDNDGAINIGTQGERSISIGTGAFADTITIGNTTAATAVNMTAPGGIRVAGLFAAAGTSGTFGTFSQSDATPSVAAGNVWKTYAASLTITDFDGGAAGQTIYVLSTDAVVFDLSAHLNGGTTNITTAAGDVTIWTNIDGTYWYLNSFMDQSSNMGSSGAYTLNELSDILIETNSLYIGPTAAGMSQTNTASYNIGVGVTALDAVTTGDNNTAIGYNAATALTTGADNILIGSGTGAATTAGSSLVIIGKGAGAADMTSAANGTVSIGASAGAAITTGAGNTIMGAFSGQSLTTGDKNTAIGQYSLDAQVTGDNNTAVGYNALTANATADTLGDNTAVGYSAGSGVTTGIKNTLLGSEVGLTSAIVSSGTLDENGTSTTVFTLESGQDSNDDVYIGLSIKFTAGTLVNVGSAQIISDYVGSSNTITTGAFSSTPQSGDTYEIISLSLTSGSNNSFIGYASGGLGTANNQTSLGYQAGCFAANQITLGNPSVTALRCADSTIASLSDQRDKINVSDSTFGLSFINSIRPVQYEWNRRHLEPGDSTSVLNGKTRVGFLAQELQSAMPNNENDILDLVYDANTNRLEAKYGNLIPILTNAIKELSAANDALVARVAALESA